jgi:esterase/lipase superfamily enzyme
VLSTLPTSREDFITLLHSALAEDHTGLFVFIHGFNVGFEDAACRTAQLAYDLGFHGPPVLYSWPSDGKKTSYMADEATIEWTKPHLKQFIEDLITQFGSSGVHLIAHSMGSRALIRVLNELGNLSANEGLVKQVILTAPDIDTGEFHQLAAAMTSTAQRVTLYASSNDIAIQMSKQFHKYPIAGEAESNLVIEKDIDTIDSSTVNTSLLGHSYYCEQRTVISDLFYLISAGIPPSMRHGLEPRTCQLGQYWAFKA